MASSVSMDLRERVDALKQRRILVACALVLVCAGCAAPTNTEAERQQIQQVLDSYLRSVKTADATLASTIWMQSPEVDVVTPLGRTHGWDAVQRELYVNFLQKSFLERDLQASDIHIHVNGASAWSTFDWSFTAKLANGQPFTSKGRESHVYEKAGGAWRIVQLHYSGLQPGQTQ